MKKKYVTPNMEKIQCLSQSFMAGSPGDQSAESQHGTNNGSVIQTDDAGGQKSKWHDTWDTWED